MIIHKTKYLTMIFLFIVVMGCKTKNQNNAIKAKQEAQLIAHTDQILEEFELRKESLPKNNFKLSYDHLKNSNFDSGGVSYVLDSVKILVIKNFTSLGKSEYYYFIKESEIFYAKEIISEYNHPFEISGSEIVSLTRSDFYFHKDELIRLIKNDKLIEIDSESVQRGKDILNRGRELWISQE